MINKLQALAAEKRGFTLVETLIAVLILATAVVGPLSVASRGLSTALIAKDQVTAYYLAQDALEFVRFARDTNKLESGDWITGAGALDTTKTFDLTKCTTANGCSLDSTRGFASTASGGLPANPDQCSASSCTQGNLRYHTDTHLYTSPATNATGLAFNRVIKITTPTNGGTTEKTVSVVVSWSDAGGITRSVNITENIFNWQ
jgi:prepilin-type N-terminal cleavage/methylation domain-containing protein